MIRSMMATVVGGFMAHRLDAPLDRWFPPAKSRAINLLARYGAGGSVVFLAYIVLIWDTMPEPYRRDAIRDLFLALGLVGMGVLSGYLAERRG